MAKNTAKGSKKQAASQQNGLSKPTVVGIGASAGGLTALRKLFESVPADSGLVFVVVVHLSPEHKSHLADLLQPSVKFPVRQVTSTVGLEPNNVYVIPPNANLSAIDTHLRLSKLEENRRERAPIDHFLRTLAKTHDGHSIGVILTGTGSDGTLGLREVKAKGGVILVQDPNEAEFDGMPQSAIATGLVDRVLPLAAIPEVLIRLATVEPKLKRAAEGEDPTASERVLLPKVVAILKTRTDRDFSRYKSATLLRRIARRMQLNYLDDLEAYLNKLREQPEEARALADDLLINVTSFFRDPEIFKKLQAEAVPHLFLGKGSMDTVRVWSVGCATGEEAYSLAMILIEEAARHEAPPKLQIFASDLHKQSLDSAREGLYPGDIQTDVSPERLERFFQKENGGYRICKEVRDMVVFAPHNLLSDPPFSRLDLIACRNLLIYLERGVQRDVIDLFHYALCPNGYLLLGSAETIDASELFRTEDKKLCIYRKRNVPVPEPRLPVFPLTRFRIGTEPSARAESTPSNVPFQSLHQDLLERFAPPSILVGPDNKLVHSSEHAGRYLVIPGGETTVSALRLVREELRIELSALLRSARDGKDTLDSRPIPVRFNGHSAPVVMHVRPAQNADQEGFVLVIFEEHQAHAPSADGKISEAVAGDTSHLAERNRELEIELNTARQRLQAVIEEYETSREEMKASHEEMQSTNEELRSTMEELETSKEELQSINEELQTVNQENRHKVEELSQLSSDLQNLLTSTDIATLFLDRDFRILRFTPRLADLFNVRVTDRGRPISDLTHRLGYQQLREDARVVLDRLVPIEREIQDEAGRWYLTRVLPYRSTDDRIEGVVITFVEITARKKTEEALRESETLRRVALAGGRMGTWRWNLAARAVSGDAQFLALWGFPPSNDPLPLSAFTARMSPEGSAEMETVVTKAIASREEFDGPLEIVSGPTTGRWIRWRGRADALDESVLYGVSFDITEQKQAETLTRESEQRQTFLLKLNDAIRPLTDAEQIRLTACRLLGEHLQASRALYVDFDPERNTGIVSEDYRVAGLPSLAGTYPFEAFRSTYERLSTGETWVVADVEKAAEIRAQERDFYTAQGLFAWANSPLAKAGRLEASLCVLQSRARQWTEQEIALIDDVADRLWAAVQRGRAEAALASSEEKYRNLFNSIDEGVITFEVLFDEQGRAVDWIIRDNNPALTRITGLPPNIRGKRASEVYSALEPYWMETFGRVAKTGEPVRAENFVRELNRWFDCFASRVGGEGSNKVVGVYNDITERKRAEAALRESEERYRTLFGRMEEGFAVLERIGLGEGERRDFRYVLTNPAWSRHTGYGSSEGRTVLQLTPGMDSFIFDKFDEALRTGQSQVFETPITARKLWVHAEAFPAGPPNHVAVIFSNINERKRAEQELLEGDERKAVLLKLSDALNSVSGPVEIQQAAMRILSEHLSLSRAFYFRVERDNDGWAHVIDSEYTCVPGLPSMVGRHSLKNFGTPLFEQLAQGIPLLVDDVAALPGISPRELASYQAVGVTAFVNVPLRRNGEYSAGITAHDVAPRTWEPAEIDLMREVGDRVWAAVERALAEEALRESEERLRQFGDASQDVLWIRDAETFQWEYLTPAFETIYGFGREAALRGDNMTSWLELIVPEDREAASASLKRVRSGEWVTFEFRIKRPADGAIRWLRNTDFPITDVAGAVTRIGGIGHDITEVKVAEKALEAAEERQRALLEGIPQLVWRAADGGQWTWASPQWTEYTGQSNADSQDRGWLEAVHPEDRDAAWVHWSTAMETGSFEMDYRIRRAATQTYRWFHTRATPVRNAAGAIVEWLGTSTDIEDLKQVEAEREQAAAFTRSALAEKEELLKEVHHRVKNNLQVITSLLNLQADQITDKQTLVAFDEARNRVASIAAIHELLYRSSSLSAIHLADYAREFAPSLLNFYGLQKRIKVEVSGDGAKLELERAVPYGLLLNELLSNAYKHAFPGERGGAIRISFEESGDTVLLRVADDGVGLPDGFEVEKTSSLGLKLVERLARQLRGGVVFKRAEEGTLVEVEFPITTSSRA